MRRSKPQSASSSNAGRAFSERGRSGSGGQSIADSPANVKPGDRREIRGIYRESGRDYRSVRNPMFAGRLRAELGAISRGRSRNCRRRWRSLSLTGSNRERTDAKRYCSSAEWATRLGCTHRAARPQSVTANKCRRRALMINSPTTHGAIGFSTDLASVDDARLRFVGRERNFGQRFADPFDGYQARRV